MSKIDTIQELREKKEVLQLKMKYTRKAFEGSLTALKDESLQSVEDVISTKFPSIEFFSQALKLISSIVPEEKEKESESTAMVSEEYVEQKSAAWYQPLIPVAIDMISDFAKTYLQKKLSQPDTNQLTKQPEQNGQEKRVRHAAPA